MVDEKTRNMAVKEGGFGVPNVNIFWKSIRMSWLGDLLDLNQLGLNSTNKKCFPMRLILTNLILSPLSKPKQNAVIHSGKRYILHLLTED